MEFWARPGLPSTSRAPAQASVLLAPPPPWEAPNVALFSVCVKHWALPPALGASQVGQDSGSKQGGRRQAGKEGEAGAAGAGEAVGKAAAWTCSVEGTD